jgi:hypothetical protein
MALFGLAESSLGCPDYQRRETLGKIRIYLERNKKLPAPCNECYTIIVYVGKEEINLERFKTMISQNYQPIPRERKGQWGYFRIRDGERKEEFIRELKRKLAEYEVEGKVEWRLCCKRLEKEFPGLINGKRFGEGWQQKLF